MAAPAPYDFSYKPTTGPYTPAVLEPAGSSSGGVSVRRITNALLSPVSSPLLKLKATFDDWRRSNGYEDRPGSLEDLSKSIRNVHASNYLFDGAKADLQKTVSINPIFQVSHAFTVGSSLAPSVTAGTYNFSAVRGTESSLITGAIDGDGSMQGRANFAWRPGFDDAITKCQFQLAPGAMGNSIFVFQQDVNGPGYHSSLKLINPSITDGTGSASLSSLYSVTRRLAIGAEALAQRSPFQSTKSAFATELGFQLGARYAAPDWTGTVQVTPTGTTSLGYLHRLNERVEAAGELQLVPSLQPRGRQAVATLGVKYEYRPATFRGQVDSTGKVAAYLEHRLNPIMSFLMSGEIDHAKNTSKFGIGFQLDTATIDEQAAATATPVKVPT